MLTVQNLSHDPFYNQAFEEYIYQTYQDDDIFLLWQNSPAVVVGSYQNICGGSPWCGGSAAAGRSITTWVM